MLTVDANKTTSMGDRPVEYMKTLEEHRNPKAVNMTQFSKEA